LSGKYSDYAQLVKLRLSAFVVFSAAMAYLWGTNRNVDTATIWLLSVGGFLITASANAFNQIIERNSDKLMKRTANRPLATGRMLLKEAYILAITLGTTGLFILSQINFLCIALGAAAMFIYACVYTPLKQFTPFSVVPGAIAGSLPVMIGWSAATGYIGKGALLLFLMQFLWQFTHTWAIAWLLNADYNKAGIRMLPFSEKGPSSAAMIVLSTFLIVPSGLLLYMYGVASFFTTGLVTIAGLIMVLFSIKLFFRRTDKLAARLMLSSLAYLPFVLIVLVIDNLL
jgi:protoheme IX farnesyltransferase